MQFFYQDYYYSFYILSLHFKETYYLPRKGKAPGGLLYSKYHNIKSKRGLHTNDYELPKRKKLQIEKTSTRTFTDGEYIRII